jgi:hypothetical protein
MWTLVNEVRRRARRDGGMMHRTEGGKMRKKRRGDDAQN